MSKPIAALAALRLVQEGKLSLDTDVNSVLTTWKVPTSSAAPDAAVTLRELLTHTAGFTVHGFPGYAAGTVVPTLVEVLNGEKPANTAPIRVESAPGSTWKYSGHFRVYGKTRRQTRDGDFWRLARVLSCLSRSGLGGKASSGSGPRD